VVPQRPPTPQRLTLFSGEQATKACPRSTKRCPWRRHDTFTQSIGASSRTQLDAPNKPTRLLHRKIELGEALLPARVPRNPRVTSPSKKWRGKSNRFGGSVDLGLRPRIPKGLQVLVARMGDLVILSFATMDEREWKPQSSPEVEDNYLYPSRISSHWGRLTAESPNYKGWTLWPVRTGVSGSQVQILGVSGWSP
jgi:hypothetical protein